MKFDRHRRLRISETMRNLVRENHVRKEDLIYPTFVVEKDNVKSEITSLPGVYQISLNLLDDEINEAYDLGIRAIMFFGVPNAKDEVGSGAYDLNGVVQQATRKAKSLHEDLLIVADTCLCEYTDHVIVVSLMNIHMMLIMTNHCHYLLKQLFLKLKLVQILLHLAI